MSGQPPEKLPWPPMNSQPAISVAASTFTLDLGGVVPVDDERRVDLEAAVLERALAQPGRVGVDAGVDDLDVLQHDDHVGRR